MSRLSAQKEFVFMKALHENGFKVPEPIAWNRHTVIMSLIDGVPLRAVKEIRDPAGLYGELMEMIVRLARHGLIHSDFNEFNIMIEEKDRGSDSPQSTTLEEMPTMKEPVSDHFQKESITELEATTNVIPWLIDFPQAVSIDHSNAKFYFERDVQCIKTFFARRFGFQASESGPSFQDITVRPGDVGAGVLKRLDVEVEASGFSRKMAKDLEEYLGNVESEEDSQDKVDEDMSDQEKGLG